MLASACTVQTTAPFRPCDLAIICTCQVYSVLQLASHVGALGNPDLGELAENMTKKHLHAQVYEAWQAEAGRGCTYHQKGRWKVSGL